MAIHLRKRGRNWKNAIRAGLIVHEVLAAVAGKPVKPGVTTMDLEKLADQKLVANLASRHLRATRVIVFVVYFGERRDRSRYPFAEAQVCVRAISFPSDFGMEVDGYYADSAVTGSGGGR